MKRRTLGRAASQALAGVALPLLAFAAEPHAVLADRVARVREQLEAVISEVESTPDARVELQLARAALIDAGGDPSWLDAFSEHARSLEWTDPEALVRDAAGALSLVESELRALDAREQDGPARARNRLSERRDGERLTALAADPEFAGIHDRAADPGAFERFLARLQAAIFERLGGEGVRRTTEVVGWVLKRVVALAALATAVWMVLRGIRLARTRRARWRPVPAAPASAESGALAAVAQLVAEGRLREALRVVHLATLAELARRGVVSGRPGHTHWEELRTLAAHGAERDRVDGLAELNREFDRVWYRGEPVDGQRLARFRAASDAWLAVRDGDGA